MVAWKSAITREGGELEHILQTHHDAILTTPTKLSTHPPYRLVPSKSRWISQPKDLSHYLVSRLVIPTDPP